MLWKHVFDHHAEVFSILILFTKHYKLRYNPYILNQIIDIIFRDIIWWDEYAVQDVLKLLNTIFFFLPLYLLLFGVYLLLYLVLDQISIIVTIEEFSFL